MRSKSTVPKLVRTFGAVVALLGAAPVAEATFTCETVARRGDVDPGGAVFSSKFDEQSAVNGAGDVVFTARAGSFQQTVYAYPDAGISRIVARVGQPEPGGSAFTRFGGGCFGRLSINTAGTIAFFARIGLPGEGVYVDVGGTLEKAARTTDPSPSGGTFVSFPAVSAIDDANQVHFVGLVSGGPNGVFRYDADTDTLVTIVDTTGTDSLARPFCEFQEVGASDAGLAIRATVGIPDCNTPVQGVFRDAGGFVPVALVGDASPVGGSTYTLFTDAPQVGGTTTFAARVSGVYSGEGVFAATPTAVVKGGDASPDTGGLVKKLGGQHRQTLAGDVFVWLFLRQTPAKHGVFHYDGTPEAALVKTDAPPAPFGVGSKIRAIGPPSADENGVWFAARVKATDTTKPRSKIGIWRCAP